MNGTLCIVKLFGLLLTDWLVSKFHPRNHSFGISASDLVSKVVALRPVVANQNSLCLVGFVDALVFFRKKNIMGVKGTIGGSVAYG